jgi:hypothetical protein
MFNGTTFQERAADFDVSFKSVKKLQRQFKVSLYAALRQYTRTHQSTCIALCCELPTFCFERGFTCEVRRVEISPAYERQFGKPSVSEISKGHTLADLVPFGRKATKPTIFLILDKNGKKHEFIGEALDTTFNVLIFGCLLADFQL